MGKNGCGVACLRIVSMEEEMCGGFSNEIFQHTIYWDARKKSETLFICFIPLELVAPPHPLPLLSISAMNPLVGEKASASYASNIEKQHHNGGNSFPILPIHTRVYDVPPKPKAFANPGPL